MDRGISLSFPDDVRANDWSLTGVIGDRFRAPIVMAIVKLVGRVRTTDVPFPIFDLRCGP